MVLRKKQTLHLNGSSGNRESQFPRSSVIIYLFANTKTATLIRREQLSTVWKIGLSTILVKCYNIMFYSFAYILNRQQRSSKGKTTSHEENMIMATHHFQQTPTNSPLSHRNGNNRPTCFSLLNHFLKQKLAHCTDTVCKLRFTDCSQWPLLQSKCQNNGVVEYTTNTIPTLMCLESKIAVWLPEWLCRLHFTENVWQIVILWCFIIEMLLVEFSLAKLPSVSGLTCTHKHSIYHCMEGTCLTLVLFQCLGR